MKLFPALVATLLQEGEAACNGSPVFEVTCHEDLKVELAVNTDCLTEKFPNVELTELQINPTDAQGTVPTNQCLPCTDADPVTNCNTENNFMGYDFTNDANASPVSSATTSLFFKAGQCGTSMEISTDGSLAIFKTDIGKPAEIIDGIVVEPTLLETDITCSYPSTISGIPMDPGMTVVADASQDGDKISQDSSLDAVSQSLFTMTSRISAGNTGTAISSTDSITLGTRVYITVETTDEASGITDFYLGDCTASDGAATPKTLKLVTDGCMEDLGNPSLLAEIAPQSSGQVLQFNQFAFADAAEVSLALNFEVTCDIILGAGPSDATCATRRDGAQAVTDPTTNDVIQAEIIANPDLTGSAGRRRRATAVGYSETTEYQVSAGNKITEVDSGIVVAHSGSGKATDADSGAVSAAVAMMAGTAVMLL